MGQCCFNYFNFRSYSVFFNKHKENKAFSFYDMDAFTFSLAVKVASIVAVTPGKLQLEVIILSSPTSRNWF